jgi:phosphoglucomutase
VADYAALMEPVRFRRDPRGGGGGFTMSFDAMHAVTGPYAREILESGWALRPAR